MRFLKNNLKYIILFVAVHYACVDKQNFDQFDDLSVTPIVTSSLVFVESPEQVINDAPAGNFYSQDFNFDAFNEEFFAERVLEGSITYEIENTTSKPLEISFSFIDEASNVLDTETFLVNAAPTAVLTREIFYGGATGRSLDIIRNTSGIRVFARNLGDNTSVSTLPDPKIVLRTSGSFRLRLK